MKKVIAFLLTVITFLSFAAAAFALTQTQQEILKHYEEVMSGSWKHMASDGLEFTFEPERLLITADNKVYYNYYSKDLSFISRRTGYALAEVLLSNDPSIIVLKKHDDLAGYDVFLYFQKMD